MQEPPRPLPAAQTLLHAANNAYRWSVLVDVAVCKNDRNDEKMFFAHTRIASCYYFSLRLRLTSQARLDAWSVSHCLRGNPMFVSLLLHHLMRFEPVCALMPKPKRSQPDQGTIQYCPSSTIPVVHNCALMHATATPWLAALMLVLNKNLGREDQRTILGFQHKAS
jgi:hypothetical protein